MAELKFSNNDFLNLARILNNHQTAQKVVSSKLYNLQVMQSWLLQSTAHPNPLCKYGNKCFSQTDEDGITFEICRRIGLAEGQFIEFGIGDGTENNTLALAAAGWSGTWFGNENLAFSTEGSRIKYKQGWITLDNVFDIVLEAGVDPPCVDLVSFDLDGNDYYMIDKLLTHGLKPKVFISEYNAKFMPPIRFKIELDESHRWNHDDYFGASLSSLDDLFSGHGYRLVCCNSASGANAFFVQSHYADLFADVPDGISNIYSPPNYNLLSSYGHRPSIKSIEHLIQ